MIRIHTDCFSFDFPTPWLPHPVITLKIWIAAADNKRERWYITNYNTNHITWCKIKTSTLKYIINMSHAQDPYIVHMLQKVGELLKALMLV